MGAEEALAGDLPDDHRRGGRRHVVHEAGPRRGPADHRAHHDRGRRLARCDGGRDGQAGDRAARADPAGDRLPRPHPQLHHRRADDDLRRPGAIDAARQDSRHLVPGAQEHRRHAPHAAAGRARAVPQRQLRRHLRHHLRVHRRRLQLPRTARLRGGRALAPAAGARRLEDRGAGCAGRADLHRVLARAPGGPAPEPEPDRGHAAGAEPGATGRHDAGRAGARVPARDRRLRLRKRHRGGELRLRRPHLPPRRHRHGAARLHRPAAADVPRQRQAGDRPGDRDARCRRHPGAGREPAPRDDRHQGQPAGGHRNDAGGRPGGDGRSGDQRLHDLAVAGHRHHSGVQLRQPGRTARRGGGAGDSADDGDRVRDHGRGQHRPAPHLAGRADHRARDAGRRRDDHGGRDAAPARRRRHARTKRRPSPTVRWPRRCWSARW